MQWEIRDIQAGFWNGRGTQDYIANNCWLLEHTKQISEEIIIFFIVYSKAFDCVDHVKFWIVLKEMGVP